ncbi:fungal specific transcription factor domain-containing protein [Stemphylium lycopersici]|uniref:Fungal specific transcription factor domain-containing protein n=1 Tax=Stemphylium lycopersici TaxID=183478 RepID=A0A364NDC7_STELY|nr:fungal specific transcription factor domain-containing protein [Stemphylium lycopersici]RAR15101.1 fungal specific transcription factor domain-containing protein [Stemphylium lycopersici]
MSSAGVEKRGSASTVRRSKPQKGNRIVEYESRIKRLESLLHERGAAQPEVRQQPILRVTDASIPLSTWVNSLRQEVEAGPRPQLPDFNPFDLDPVGEGPGVAFDETLATLSIDESHQAAFGMDISTQYPLGNMTPSSDFHEDAALLQSANYEPDMVNSGNPLLPSVPPQPEQELYLPSPELGTTLLAEYLTDLNSAYPLYQPHVIADHLRTCYAGNADGSAVAWSSAYIIFSMAHHVRAMGAAGTSYDTDMAQYYLARVYSGLSDLLNEPPSLGQVQCLIGVALLIMSSSCSYNKAEGHFVSTALRIIRSLAADPPHLDSPLTSIDGAQQRRVFWIAFVNDVNLSIMNNTPTTHRLEDVSNCADFVADEISAIATAGNNWRIHIFWLSTRLALLEIEAIDQVLSHAHNNVPLDVAAAATIVLARLHTFRQQHQIFQLKPSQTFQLLYRTDVVHAVALEAMYFATVYRLHALMALDMDPGINPFEINGLVRMSQLKQHKSYEAAKRLMEVLPIAPRGNIALYWLVHPTFIAALVTIFSHHINNPTAPPLTTAELRICYRLLIDLGTMVEARAAACLRQKRDFCKSLFTKVELDLRERYSGGGAGPICELRSVIPQCRGMTPGRPEAL